MRPSQIEEWALRAISAVQRGRQNEDSRVELKSSWPDPYKAARRIAGHANAAQGDDILWLIGLSEDGTLPGLESEELANWWPQVLAHIRPPLPEAQPVTINVGDEVVVALRIETSRAPYLVKNPRYGTADGGPIELEVPWRELTAVRTARHEDLVRILVPQANLPITEVIDADLKAEGKFDPHIGSIVPPAQTTDKTWVLSASLYFVPRQVALVVLPAHKCSVRLREDSFEGVQLTLQQRDTRGALSTLKDIVIEQPRRFELQSRFEAVGPTPSIETVELTLTFVPAGDIRALVVESRLERVGRFHFALRNPASSTGP